MQTHVRTLSKLLFWSGILLAAQSAYAIDPKCVPQEFIKSLVPETAPTLGGGFPESAGVTRKQLATTGLYEPTLKSVEYNQDGTLALMKFIPKPGKAIEYDGVKYIEFPNSTAFRYVDENGVEHEYLATRGVRDGYENHVKVDGSQSPQDYVSDVLIFKRMPDGKFEFQKTILKSRPDLGFLFEDPRVSVIYGKTGKPHFFLSGTDYSSHVPGSMNKDVMNRFVPLKMGKNGEILPINVDAATGKPAFFDMSPAPQLRPDGNYSFVDAKNGTIAQNEKGQIVVRLRLRPDFGDPEIKKIFGDTHWHYGEQAYVFDDWKAFRKYDWKHSLEDLAHPNNTSGVAGRVRPVEATELIRDEDLVEMYKDGRVMPEKGKGLGPGASPIRVVRKGNFIWASDGLNAPEILMGEIPKELRKSYALKPGEVKFLTPDHEIRYFKDNTFVKRHYTGTFKLFDDRLTKIEAYYADAMQPITERERGITSGILDLQHTYPMGRFLRRGANGKGEFSVISGISDANTAEYGVDLMKVLEEMSPGSERWKTGQVYMPRSYSAAPPIRTREMGSAGTLAIPAKKVLQDANSDSTQNQ